MIFVTVGTQLPFPRLIDAMEELAPELDEAVIAQVGPDRTPRHRIETRPSLPPAELESKMNDARVIVAHAGIGTVLAAKRIGKPLLLVPRRHELGEHRNDHQMATARELADRPGLYVAWHERDLASLLKGTRLIPMTDDPGPTTAELNARLRSFINGL